ncbi:hypothetical protein SXCC_02249 [Gluconacetobacter sp. SXCC-1]|nr:hypothetical protein SXCC_02249 [Gluconacetobacter sp. SXCC-1]
MPHLRVFSISIPIWIMILPPDGTHQGSGQQPIRPMHASNYITSGTSPYTEQS